MTPIAPTELAAWLADAARAQPQLLDVREPWEVALCQLPGATLVPMAQTPEALDRLDPRRPVVCYCHHGMRSAQVALFLQRNGFAEVFNLTGGIDGWARQVDAAVAVY
jgi:rhodanese-related sulfurtransferase